MLRLPPGSFVERLVGYILQFVTWGMGNELATTGQSDYESEPILAGLIGPMKQNLHLARDHGKLSLLARNVDGEALRAAPLGLVRRMAPTACVYRLCKRLV
jgi:hypothetical protein